MTKNTVLITGKNGQLGNELQLLSQLYPDYNYIFTDAVELDITNTEKVNDLFSRHKPSICINAAAYTAVDKAETEKQTALAVNAYAVANLAENCGKINCRFIHISTDYVFAGTSSKPYTEEDSVDPVNYYGETKLKGERLALEILPSTVVIRTSWVYSSFGNNFVKTMLRLMKERATVSVVDDQTGSPTYAADLAGTIMGIAFSENDKGGIYHFSNEGTISWFDFAIAVKELSGLQCDVKPINTSSYPTAAKRPAYSVMSKEKIKSTFGIDLKNWKESLQKCIKLLQPNN